MRIPALMSRSYSEAFVCLEQMTDTAATAHSRRSGIRTGMAGFSRRLQIGFRGE